MKNTEKFLPRPPAKSLDIFQDEQKVSPQDPLGGSFGNLRTHPELRKANRPGPYGVLQLRWYHQGSVHGLASLESLQSH